MIVDTSAVIAIVKNETHAHRLVDAIRIAPVTRISAANLLETYMVIDGSRDAHTVRTATMLLDRLELVVEPVTEAHVFIAREAFRRFGKGSGHRARLNFGDCFAYALAKSSGEPLLFVGDDFSLTDIPAVWDVTSDS